MSEAAEVEPDDSDLEHIVPLEKTIEVDGCTCRVRRLKTIEILSAMNVLTAGIGPGLVTAQIDWSSPETIGADFAALAMIAAPSAPDEVVVFLRRVVEVVDDNDAPKVAAALQNPEIDVVLDVIETIATQEKDDLSVLVGKVRSMTGRLETLYTAKKRTAKKTSRGSGGRSRARST